MRQSFAGKCFLEITCADRVSLINAINKEKIKLENIVYCNDLVLRLRISNNDYLRLLEIAKKYGASVEVIEKNGIYWRVCSVLRRPVLMLLLVFLTFLFCYLPSKVLFVSVEGNQSVPEKMIIEAASQCGLGFGAQRRQVKSENVKNKLLQKIPQLQWAGINTKGCVAVISVKEKTLENEVHRKTNQVSSIVASRDGVIQNFTVYQGNSLCSVGQAVKKGQTLVSGYVDCGTVIKATQANAEINALTFRELQIITPTTGLSRGDIQRKRTNYSLRIGKKHIKFYKDSGNLDTTCGKIYVEKYLQLPGGFKLPIAIAKEILISYRQSSETPIMLDGNKWLSNYAERYLQSTMVAGEIVSAQTDVVTTDTACILNGKYACVEMIGQIKYEQTLENGDIND